MELMIFSDKQLGSVHEWQTAVDAEGFPLRGAEPPTTESITLWR
jgi:hypothetical protein